MAKDRLKALDVALSEAEARHVELRRQQEQAASGDAGPQEQARRVLEAGLAKASFPDLKVLAAETTTTDDDRIVDALIKLRTEELQMEVNWRNVEALPARRRAGAETLEQVRRRFKEAGLDSPYVMLLRRPFEAAMEAYGKGPAPDGEALWRAIKATVRQAPRSDDDYFGGPRRGRNVGVGDVDRGRHPRRGDQGGDARQPLGRRRLGRRIWRRRWLARRRRFQDRRPHGRRRVQDGRAVLERTLRVGEPGPSWFDGRRFAAAHHERPSLRSRDRSGERSW